MLLPIHQVFVHRDGALVHRRGHVEVVDGNAIIDGLPLLLEPASLRVKLPEAEPLAVRLELDVRGRTREDLAQLQRNWRALNEARRRLHTEILAHRAERASLGAMVPAHPDESEVLTRPTAARLQSWLAAEDAVEPWVEALDATLRDLEARHTLLKEEERQARAALEDATESPWSGEREPTRRVVVRVDAPGPVEVRVSYRISGATWTPAYALHADSAFRRGRLVLRALVAQSTGEDWSQARVSLSTCPSSRRVGLPTLPSLRLGTAQPAPPSPWRPLPADLMSLFPPELLPPADPPSAPMLYGASPVSASMPQSAPPPSSAAGSAPIAKRKAAKRTAKPARAELAHRELDASAVAPPPEPPGPLHVRPDALDYPHLRLADWTGERPGQLAPTSLDALAREAGLPEEAARNLVRTRDALERGAKRVNRIQLPPHHVLPEPIGGADFRYDAQDAADIPSDGRFHSLSVREEEVGLTVRYRVVPALDARVFRRVTGKRETEVPLLPGPVDVFVDGSLVLTVPWDGSSDGTTLSFGLGVEEGLRVARNVRHREESKGLFGGARRLFTEIDLEVASSLSRAADLEVLERVPVAAEEGLTVALYKAQPEAEPYTGETDAPELKGGRRQSLTIPAGGQRSAELSWYIDLPARRELIGGDRRV